MKISGKIGTTAIAHPRSMLWALLVLTIALALGVYRTTLQTDYRYYFDPHSPDRLSFAHLEARFGGTDDIVLALVPDSGKALTRENILRLGAIHDALLDTPYAQRVSSVANIPVALPGTGTSQGAQITSLRLLAEADMPDPEQWAQAIAAVADLTTGTLLAADRSIAAAHVRVVLPPDNDFWDTRAVLKHAQQIRKDFEARHTDARLLLVGVLPYGHQIMELAMRDIYALFPFCIAIAGLMLRMLLGSWRAAGACAVPVLFAVLSTIGVNGWLDLPVTAVTMGVPVLVMVIALAYAVHLADTHLQLRAHHVSPRQAALQSVQENFQPVILTAATTMLGFVAMNLSISPPYRALGTITAIGVGISMIYVLLLMPAVLTLADPPHGAHTAPLRRFVERISVRVPRPFGPSGLLVSGLVMLGLLASIALNTIDDEVSHWLSDRLRLRQDYALLSERLAGVQRLYFQLPSSTQTGVHDPTYLRQVDAFEHWLRQRPEVVAVRSLPPLVRRLNQSFGDGSNQIPAQPAVTEQLLWTYAFSSPPGDRITGLVSDDRRASLVVAILRDSSGEVLNTLNEQAQIWLDQHAGNLEVPDAGGGMIMFSRLAKQNILPMILGTLGVLLCVAVLIGWMFRSLRFALISIVPNLLPVGLAFGAWGLISGHVGIALSVICAAAVGIIVDDSIHLLLRYRQFREGGAVSPAVACNRAIRRVGGAITITTAVLCLGVGMIGFSQIQPTHELGVWLTLAIGFAWFCDLYLLPQLLIRFDR